MDSLSIIPTSQLPAAVAGDSHGPAVVDGHDLGVLYALADRASLLAPRIDDPSAAEAIRLLSLALDRAASLLADLVSALHHGSAGVVNYPESIAPFAGVVWRTESKEGRTHKIEQEPLDVRSFIGDGK